MLSAVEAKRFQMSSVAVDSGGTAPPPRTQASMQSFGDVAVLFGGKSESGPALGDTWLFHSSNNSWTPVHLPTTSNPSARYSALPAILSFGARPEDRYFFVIGGRNANGALKSSLTWAFHISTKTWSPVEVSAQIPSNSNQNQTSHALSRYAAAGGATSNGTVIVLAHGIDASESPRSDTIELKFATPTTATCRTIYGSVGRYSIGDPHGMAKAAFVVTRANELVIAGGCYGLGLCPSQDAWSFDHYSREWRFMSRGPGPQFLGSMANGLPAFAEAGLDHRQSVVLWGGQDDSKQMIGTSDISSLRLDILNVRTKVWSREAIKLSPADASDIPYHRSGASMVQVGTGTESDPFRYIVYGGIEQRGKGDKGLASKTLKITFMPTAEATTTRGRATFSNFLVLHGILMGVAFGIMCPLGVVVARYMRYFKGTHYWFILHWVGQVLCIILSYAGIVMTIKGLSSGVVSHPHAVIGILLMVLVSVQVLVALPGIRPAPDAGRIRTVWSGFHRWCGRVAGLLAVINVLLGLLLIVAPVGVWIFWLVVLAAAVAAIASLECFRLCITDHKDDMYEKYDAQVGDGSGGSGETSSGVIPSSGAVAGVPLAAGARRNGQGPGRHPDNQSSYDSFSGNDASTSIGLHSQSLIELGGDFRYF